MRDPRSLVRFAPVALGMAVAVLGTGAYTAGALDEPEAPTAQFHVVADAIDDAVADAPIELPPADLATLLPDLTAQGLTQAADGDIEYGNWAQSTDAAVVLRDPSQPNDRTVAAFFDQLGFIRGAGHLWLKGDGLELTVEVNVFEFARISSPAALGVAMNGICRQQGLDTYDTDFDRGTAAAGMLQLGTGEVHAFHATAVRGHRLFRVLALSGTADPDPELVLGILRTMAVDE